MHGKEDYPWRDFLLVSLIINHQENWPYPIVNLLSCRGIYSYMISYCLPVVLEGPSYGFKAE